MRAPRETEFDVILWGATGFTGALVAERLAVTQAAHGARWALAGRDLAKLERVRARLAEKVPSCAELPLLVGDARDPASLDALAARAKVVCSAVGPYARYGSELVAACVRAGADYCDLTGEVLWMRRMIDAWHEKARETGARIVHACGFDSIPSDLGVLALQDHARERHGAPCERVTLYVGESRGGASGGTVASMLTMLDEVTHDREARRLAADPWALDPALRGTRRGARDPMGVRYDRALSQWTGPFIMAAVNTRVVRRSHALLGYPWGEGFDYQELASYGRGADGLARAVMVTGALGVFVATMAVGPLRRLVEERVLPAPGEGPSEETRTRGYFVMRLRGSVKGAEVRYLVKAKGDPGYAATSVMLAESALSLAQDDLPAEGGVLTPASCMGTKLLKRLRRAGMTFEPEG